MWAKAATKTGKAKPETISEQYLEEAYYETVSFLRESVRRNRTGVCQIGNHAIKHLLARRFGLGPAATRVLRKRVVSRLTKAGILTIDQENGPDESDTDREYRHNEAYTVNGALL